MSQANPIYYSHYTMSHTKSTAVYFCSYSCIFGYAGNLIFIVSASE